jgi:hypothetical protein
LRTVPFIRVGSRKDVVALENVLEFPDAVSPAALERKYPVE